MASRVFTAPLLLSISYLCVSPPLVSIALLHFKAVAVEPYFKKLCSDYQSLTRDLQLYCLGWEAYYYYSLFPSILESSFMPLLVMDLVDSVDINAWDNFLSGCADFLNYLPVFYYLSVFDVCY